MSGPPADAVPDARPPIDRDGYRADAIIGGLIGGVFLMVGWPFVAWATAVLAGRSYDTGSTWQEGPFAGQPVAYFDLLYGKAWSDVGLFATAAAIFIEAILYLLATLRPTVASVALRAVFVVGLFGIAGNVVSAAMQVRAGFNQPIFALIGAAVCTLSAYTAWQRLTAHRGSARFGDQNRSRGRV